MSEQLKLCAKSLRLQINLNGFDFKAGIVDQDRGILGQSRAQEALQFRSAMQNPTRFSFCGENGEGCLEASLTPWTEIQDAAESAYDRSASCIAPTEPRCRGPEGSGAGRNDDRRTDPSHPP